MESSCKKILSKQVLFFGEIPTTNFVYCSEKAQFTGDQPGRVWVLCNEISVAHLGFFGHVLGIIAIKNHTTMLLAKAPVKGSMEDLIRLIGTRHEQSKKNGNSNKFRNVWQKLLKTFEDMISVWHPRFCTLP